MLSAQSHPPLCDELSPGQGGRRGPHVERREGATGGRFPPLRPGPVSVCAGGSGMLSSGG